MATKPPTIKAFFERFPDDDACLDHLMEIRYGKQFECPSCKRPSKYHRIRKRRAYECQYCGHHIYPAVGTPFHRSRTPLQLWFYVMFLFCMTRNGVSAKEIQRQTGVTYKAAWRMGHEIRKYMAAVDGDNILGGKGIVEADKAYVGGRDKMGESDKTVVFGMVERAGEIITRIVKSRAERHVVPHILENVQRGAKVATDTALTFLNLPEEGYLHGTVNHAAGEYVRGPVHTNTIEAFWGWMKRQIHGTHVHVSRKHLSKYLGEMEYRFNLRHSPALMFPILVSAFAPSPLKARQTVGVRRDVPQNESAV